MSAGVALPRAEENQTDGSLRDMRDDRAGDRPHGNVVPRRRGVSPSSFDTHRMYANKHAFARDAYVKEVRSVKPVPVRAEVRLVRPVRATAAFGASCAALSCAITLIATSGASPLISAFLLVFAVGLGVSSAGMLLSASAD